MEIKEEAIEPNENVNRRTLLTSNNNYDDVIAISSDSSDYDSDDLDDSDEYDSDSERSPRKKQKLELVLPLGFLDPLTPEERKCMQSRNGAAQSNVKTQSEKKVVNNTNNSSISRNALAVVKEEAPLAAPPAAAEDAPPVVRSCKQFWKAGDYDHQDSNRGGSTSYSVGMDHVRVHPKFLHSNATSHKWALGAFAELLDNALDEACNGATYVHIDMLENKKDKSKMLLVEDNGGGMTPDKMRQCISLGYSEKSKMANTIGQYGNGFKTSTMRLGADVIVFSRCQGKDGTSTTQSIGMLSYTFLRSTGKEDIVVPMIDYQKHGDTWNIMTRSSLDDWTRNLDTIVQWSPYENEDDLLLQFNSLKAQGTRIIIYNLWEDDQGLPELDFDTDPSDIQIRGVNRDDKKIAMAKSYPNSRHFLTYRHSLRSYASILYLRIPPGFRIVLRNIDVELHNIVNDMMQQKEITYRPIAVPDETPKDSNMVAVVTIGFVKDAKYHIDIQGFNVYHKNRLIKPFWRVWNAAGSNGRGVIGVLEANFVEPAHDKQGFERTIVLSRLEAKLNLMQKSYWSANCHLIGYAKRSHPKSPVSSEKEATPPAKDKTSRQPNSKNKSSCQPNSNGRAVSNGLLTFKSTNMTLNLASSTSDACDDEMVQYDQDIRSSPADMLKKCTSNQINDHLGKICAKTTTSSDNGHLFAQSGSVVVAKLKKENQELRESLQEALHGLQCERDRNKLLENQLQEAQKTMETLDKDQEVIIDKFLKEREQQDLEQETLKKKLQNASDTIQQLISKVKLLEKQAVFNCKTER